jgi:hypothetical protein
MGCIRHIPPDGQGVTFTLTGYQGPAQHTYTAACDGFHEPGPCPKPATPAGQVQWARDYIRVTYGLQQEDTS